MRILGVDPGDKRIGLAISDELGISANPAGVVEHVARRIDAEQIVRKAQELGAMKIVIGTALDANGQPSPSGRKAMRLGEEVRLLTHLEVVYVDEYGTTNMALSTAIEMGVKRKDRQGHRDEFAAAIILQSYLDRQQAENS
jgi:putative holliday junction resolvase